MRREKNLRGLGRLEITGKENLWGCRREVYEPSTRQAPTAENSKSSEKTHQKKDAPRRENGGKPRKNKAKKAPENRRGTPNNDRNCYGGERRRELEAGGWQ